MNIGSICQRRLVTIDGLAKAIRSGIEREAAETGAAPAAPASAAARAGRRRRRVGSVVSAPPRRLQERQ